MREYQVRFCERLGVKFPGPTRRGMPRLSIDETPESVRQPHTDVHKMIAIPPKYAVSPVTGFIQGERVIPRRCGLVRASGHAGISYRQLGQMKEVIRSIFGTIRNRMAALVQLSLWR